MLNVTIQNLIYEFAWSVLGIDTNIIIYESDDSGKDLSKTWDYVKYQKKFSSDEAIIFLLAGPMIKHSIIDFLIKTLDDDDFHVGESQRSNDGKFIAYCNIKGNTAYSAEDENMVAAWLKLGIGISQKLNSSLVLED